MSDTEWSNASQILCWTTKVIDKRIFCEGLSFRQKRISFRARKHVVLPGKLLILCIYATDETFDTIEEVGWPSANK